MSDVGHGRLERIVADVVGLDLTLVTDDLTADDVETWDSFAQVNLMVALEDEFDVRLDSERFMTLRSVRDLRSIVDQQLHGV